MLHIRKETPYQKLWLLILYYYHLYYLEEEMATQGSILAWEKPGGPQSTSLQRVRHDWVTNINIITSTYQELRYQAK